MKVAPENSVVHPANSRGVPSGGPLRDSGVPLPSGHPVKKSSKGTGSTWTSPEPGTVPESTGDSRSSAVAATTQDGLKVECFRTLDYFDDDEVTTPNLSKQDIVTFRPC